MSSNIKLEHPRDQITKIISRIYKRGMTTTSGGNISIIDDYLEVAEFNAKSVVLGASSGEMVPINDNQVEELREKFLS